MTRRRATLLLAAGTMSAAQSPTGKTRGIPVAAITIELFSDFQCPACKVLHEQTLKPLIADYVDKGKVYLIYRDFPLPIHAYARQAACLACAAAHIGKYERVADALFANQDAWSKDGRVEENRAPTDKEARFPTRNHDRQGVEVCIFKGVIRYRRQPH
jgi:protein-disulfide isomerase